MGGVGRIQSTNGLPGERFDRGRKTRDRHQGGAEALARKRTRDLEAQYQGKLGGLGCAGDLGTSVQGRPGQRPGRPGEKTE